MEVVVAMVRSSHSSRSRSNHRSRKKWQQEEPSSEPPFCDVAAVAGAWQPPTTSDNNGNNNKKAKTKTGSTRKSCSKVISSCANHTLNPPPRPSRLRAYSPPGPWTTSRPARRVQGAPGFAMPQISMIQACRVWTHLRR